MNNRRHTSRPSLRRFSRELCGLLLIGCVIGSCGDPLSVDTERRFIPVDIDSILLSEPFLGKQTDTLFANVDGRPVSFTSELIRPIFYNRNVADAWYLSVQGTAYDPDGYSYEALALRMDDIREPGTYPISDPYRLPKRVDPSLSSEYGGRYEQRTDQGKEEFVTTPTQQEGEIRVLAIDTTRGVLVGRFHFTAYDQKSGRDVRVEDGIFRLHLETW